MLAELLEEAHGDDGSAGREVLGEVRGLLHEAADEATRLGGWSAEEPLRLAKGPVTWLVRCPRRAVADPEAIARNADVDRLAVGSIVDAGLKLATLRGRAAAVSVDDALAFLAASGDETVSQRLQECEPGQAQALLDQASERLVRLAARWPRIDPPWWPRVEEPVRLRLAEGAVLFSGRLDVLLGGPPTGRPGVVVEVKSGRWHDAVRADAHLYGLLVGLRDGVAPAAVLTLAAGDSVDRGGATTQMEPVRPAVLRHTAERVAVALRTAGQLAAGVAPAAHPGAHCVHCPVRADCPESRADAA
jgi:hypothetical protein